MTQDAAFVFALIAVAAILMASNRVRYDLVALIVVLALVLGGILNIGEALAGFGSSVVILVACLLVIGEMLERTGVARSVGGHHLGLRREGHGWRHGLRGFTPGYCSGRPFGAVGKTSAWVSFEWFENGWVYRVARALSEMSLRHQAPSQRMHLTAR